MFLQPFPLGDIRCGKETDRKRAEAICALIRHCIESDRPNEDHLLVLARDYKQQRDDEKASRNMACIVRHAIDVKED